MAWPGTINKANGKFLDHNLWRNKPCNEEHEVSSDIFGSQFIIMRMRHPVFSETMNRPLV